MAHRGPRRVSATSGEDSCESSPLQLAGRSRVTRVQRVLSEETLEAVSSDPRRENGRLRQLLRVENAALAKIKDRVTQDVGSILLDLGRLRDQTKALESSNQRIEGRLLQDGQDVEESVVRHSLEDEVAQLERERVAIHNKLRKKLGDLISVNYALNRKIARLQRSAADSSDIRRLKQKATHMERDLLAMRRHYGDQEKALGNARMYLEQNTHLRNAIEKLRRKNVKSRANIEVLEQGLAAEYANLSERRARVVDLQGVRDLNREVLGAEQESQKHSLSWIQQNEQLRFYVANMESQMRILQARIDGDRLASLGGASDGSGGGGEDAEVAALRVELDTVARLREEKLAERDAVIAEKDEQEEAIKLTRAAVQTLVAEHKSVEIDVGRVNRRIKATTSRNEVLRRELLDIEEERNALMLKVAKCSALLKSVVSREQENADLSVQRQELLDENDRLKERLRAFRQTQATARHSGTDSETERLADNLLHLRGSDTEGAIAIDAKRKNTLEELIDRSDELVTDDVVHVNDRFIRNLRLEAVRRAEAAETSSQDGEGTSSAAASDDENPYQDLLPQAGAAGDAHPLDTAECRYVPNDDSERPAIMCATLEVLVERLTLEVNPDIEFTRVVLLSYRMVTSPIDLLDQLVKRYCVVPPAGMTVEEISEFRTRTQMPIRFRVFNVLKIWISDHYDDFLDAEVRESLMSFIDVTMVETGMGKHTGALKRLLEQKEAERTARIESQRMMPTVPGKEIKAFRYADPKLVAATITFEESLIYSRIGPMECFGMAWTKKNKLETSPNVVAMATRTNEIAIWVQYEVLVGVASSKKSERAAVIKKMIQVADALRTLNNFNGCMAVVSGLVSSPLIRLQRIWSRIDRRTMVVFEELRELFSARSRWRNLRAAVHSSNPPCIPFVGIYLSDLSYVNEVPSTIDGLINIIKMRMYAETILEIQQYQDLNHHDELAAAVPFTYLEFMHSHIAKAKTALPDENTAFDISQTIQPLAKKNATLRRR